MAFCEAEVLNSAKEMEDFQETVNGNGYAENGQHVRRHSPRQQGNNKLSLSWLDLRVFFVRICKCEMDDSIPEYLKVNHVPLNRDALLEVNGVRTSIYSDSVSTLLRRDRLDKKSEEVTFVSTDTIRTTGSVKFEVFHKDVLLLSGVLELSNSNGFVVESQNPGQFWSINCESDILAGTGFSNGNQYANMETASPAIEVYVAGCFSGSPIVLTKTLQLSHRRKSSRKAVLESIPENEATESPKGVSSGLAMQVHTTYSCISYCYPCLIAYCNCCINMSLSCINLLGASNAWETYMKIESLYWPLQDSTRLAHLPKPKK